MTAIMRLTDHYGAEKDLFTGDGANGTLTWNLKDNSPPAGAAINITGWAISLVVKEKIDDAAYLAGPVAGSVTDGPGGVVQFDLTAVNLAQPCDRAYVILYRTVSGKKRPLLQYWAHVRHHGT